MPQQHYFPCFLIILHTMAQVPMSCSSFSVYLPTVARLVLLAILVLSTPAGAQDSPSVDEILKKSQLAMQPPIQYQVHSKGITVRVIEKVLANGVRGVRSETDQPIARISLRAGDVAYDIYPTYGTIFDLSVMTQSLRSKRTDVANAASALGQIEASRATMKGTVVVDGRKCFVIESFVTPEVREALLEVLPEAAPEMLPQRRRHLIDSTTYELVETEAISESGGSINKCRISDIVRQSDINDEQFMVQRGIMCAG